MSHQSERLMGAMDVFRKIHILFARSMELPPGEFFTLDRVRELGKAGEVFVSDLHDNKRMTLSAVSQVVSSLEKKRLVVREMSRADRRKVSVTCTEAGEALIQRSKARIDDMIDELVRRYGQADTDQLLNQMEKLGQVVDEMRQEQAAQGEEEPTCLD